jgi:hypothetical protein
MAHAQAAIAGIVRDTSGAVIPGVTVEAASPALIEKVRSVVTDGSGQYRIIELRPGDYSVTFTLAGFNTFKRDGIELSGTGVATVNADMRVGALEETVTVSGAAPVVDTQSARQQQVMSRDLIRDLPTSKQFFGLVSLIPGMTTSQRDVGGTNLTQAGNYAIHGGRNGDGRVSIDGVTVGQRGSGGTDGGGTNMTMYSLSAGLMQETSITTSGGLGEAETGGVSVNMIPREGGNTLHGSIFGTYGNNAMQADNYDDRLRSLGLRSANEVKSISEVSGLVGGPVIKDRLWYVFSTKRQATRNWAAGMYANKNAGDVTKWTYEPDLTKRAFTDDTIRSAAIRLTFQVSQKNKVNVFWDEQWRGTDVLGGGTSTRSPEATHRMFSWPSRAFNTTWSNPLTNRVLLEAGYGGTFLQWAGKTKDRYPVNELIQVTEQAGAIPGLIYRNMSWNSNFLLPTQLHGSVAYVTGSHSAKFGASRTWNVYDDRSMNPNPIAYRFNNGVPNQLTLTDSPRFRLFRVYTGGMFAQDSWVLGKLTLQGGVRYDFSHSFFPKQQAGYTRYVPNGFSIPFTEGAAVKDITPRMAVSYDLTGDGKTALKMTLGKYMAVTELGLFGEALNPTLRLATSTTRSWNDANRNFIPDCDLLNPAVQSPATTGSIDTCGAYSDRNFGKGVQTQQTDPELLKGGWGLRQYNWEFSAAVQRQLSSKVAIDVGYYRRWFGNQLVTDNLAVGPGDYDQYSLAVPSDSRLPGGGGYTLTGLRDLKPEKFGLVNNLVSLAGNYGGKTEYWQGVDINVTGRGFRGVTFQGGTSMGKSYVDVCDLGKQLPEYFFSGAANTPEFNATFGASQTPQGQCKVSENLRVQFKGLATYVVPKIDVLISGTIQSAPGVQLAANFNVPNATIAPLLGRNLAGNAANAAINIVESGKQFGDRTNELDLRFGKILKFGSTRTNLSLDLFNALNANVGTAFNQTFGASYLVPTAIMPARFAKISVQVDF